jgi:hypothetical protein
MPFKQLDKTKSPSLLLLEPVLDDSAISKEQALNAAAIIMDAQKEHTYMLASFNEAEYAVQGSGPLDELPAKLKEIGISDNTIGLVASRFHNREQQEKTQLSL